MQFLDLLDLPTAVMIAVYFSSFAVVFIYSKSTKLNTNKMVLVLSYFAKLAFEYGEINL